jgi:hypothetical protein
MAVLDEFIEDGALAVKSYVLTADRRMRQKTHLLRENPLDAVQYCCPE